MTNDRDRPIVVTGLGRSGTTWIQSYLSQHRRVHIHGQSPNIRWETLWDWYRTLVEQGEWSQWANRQLLLDVPHYSGSLPDRARDVFKRMLYEYFTGNGRVLPRWGMKWPDLPETTDSGRQFELLWPDTFWIVCIRDPFRTIESVKNTFVPDLDVRDSAEAWVRMCKFATAHDPLRLMVIQLDRLSRHCTEQRIGALRQVLHRLSEDPTVETDSFIRRWPVVHKVKPAGEREFQLSNEERCDLLRCVPGLAEHMERLGYHGCHQEH